MSTTGKPANSPDHGPVTCANIQTCQVCWPLEPPCELPAAALLVISCEQEHVSRVRACATCCCELQRELDGSGCRACAADVRIDVLDLPGGAL